MVYSWIKEVCLADLSRSSLCKGLWPRISGEKKTMVAIFSAWTRRRPKHTSEPYPWGWESFAYFSWV